MTAKTHEEPHAHHDLCLRSLDAHRPAELDLLDDALS